MTEPNHPQQIDMQQGYQPRKHKDLGYKPKAEGPVDPATVKPPKGGSAIEPPKATAPKDSKQ